LVVRPEHKLTFVGGDVLDAPKNKRLMLLYGGEKAKNDYWRGVEDVAPYKYDGNLNITVESKI